MTKSHNIRITIAALLAAMAGSVQAAPVSGTGFSVDAIAEKEGASPDEVTDYDGLARWVFAEAGSPSIDTTMATVAVPDSSDRTFTSDFGTAFALQPYDQNNLLLSGDTLTLDTPGRYSDLQFLIFGIGGNTADNFQASVNFSDNSSTVLIFSISDWQASREYNATERTAIARRGEGGWASYFEPGVYPREIRFDLSEDDQQKVIQSIGFTFVDRLAVAAVSGTTDMLGPEFAITEVVYDSETSSLTLTWNSNPGATYAVKYSGDMGNWDADLDDGVPADAGDTTTVTFDLNGTGLEDATRVFFRIER